MLVSERGEPVGAVLLAYSSLPTRMSVVCRSSAMVARTLSRGMPGSARSVSICLRTAGSALANAGRWSNLTRSRKAVQSGWYLYWRRPRWSLPTACRCESGSALMRTSVQAGGITMPRMRSSVCCVRHLGVVDVVVAEAACPRRTLGDRAPPGSGAAAKGRRQDSRSGQRALETARVKLRQRAGRTGCRIGDQLQCVGAFRELRRFVDLLEHRQPHRAVGLVLEGEGPRFREARPPSTPRRSTRGSAPPAANHTVSRRKTQPVASRSCQTRRTNPITAAPTSAPSRAPPSTPAARASIVCESSRASARRRSVPPGMSPAAATMVRWSPSTPGAFERVDRAAHVAE